MAHDPNYTFNESSAGADATATAWSLYFNSTYAPFGTIREDGIRLRAGTSYGRYRYDGYERVGGKLVAKTVRGQVSFTDAMVGYQLGLGALTVKAFVGGAYDKHGIDTLDPSYEVAGGAFGFKGALETWFNIGQVGFAQFDASWTKAHDTYAARLRLGYRLLPELAVGLEAAAIGNVEYGGGRRGGFVRYEWAWGEVSASGGLAGDLADPDTPYASINVLLRY